MQFPAGLISEWEIVDMWMWHVNVTHVDFAIKHTDKTTGATAIFSGTSPYPGRLHIANRSAFPPLTDIFWNPQTPQTTS